MSGAKPSPLTRPGVYARWPSIELQFDRYRKTAEAHEQDIIHTLQHYAATGEKIPALAPGVTIPVWCSMRSAVLFRGALLVQNSQVQAIKNSLRHTQLGLGFRHAWFALLAELYLHESFPSRAPGRSLQMLSLSSVVWAALGLVVGCRIEAERMLFLIVEALRRNFVFDREHYPVFYFILRLYGDWNSLDITNLPKVAYREPILNELLSRWREPNPADLVPYLLAACDHHTHRCRPNSAKEFFEFDDGLFTHFPVEILTLYRLRDYEGLTNPEIDHPLMNSPLGRLPEPMPCDPDDLLRGVLNRARRQGFDEEEIAQRFVGADNKS